jgi:nicotinamidase/pyrazinamidase
MYVDYKSSALIIVDVQNDFCPAYTSPSGEARAQGALAVEGGGEVCGPLNIVAEQFAKNQGKVVATQDWHPKNHASFASFYADKKVGEIINLGIIKNQMLWPDHCVQGTLGACFHDSLDTKPVNLIIRKGGNPGLDSYSTFFENDRQTTTGLDGYLRAFSITTVYLGGLATDYCVLYSALDAVRLHYKTYVLTDAVRGVGYPENSVEQAFSAMQLVGVNLIQSTKLE